MKISKADPSLCFGFLLKSDKDYDHFKNLLIGINKKGDNALFNFYSGEDFGGSDDDDVLKF